MSTVAVVLVLALALGAAALAGSRHARRREHPRFIHHSIGFTIIAILAAASLMMFGPR